MRLTPTIRRSLLKKAKCKALLLSNCTNIEALTGLRASAGLLLLTPHGSLGFFDARYTEAASALFGAKISLHDPKDLPKILSQFSSVGFEAENVTVARLAAWKKRFTRMRMIPTTGIVEAVRRVKTTEELRRIRVACRMSKKLLSAVPSLLRDGITESDLARALEERARRLGAEAMAFETIIAFGENSSRPHHHPTSRKLRRGDIVQVDLGTKFSGYCSDYSRVFFFPSPSKKQMKVFRAVKQAHRVSAALVKPGVLVSDLDRAARDVLRKHHLEQFFTHSLGHGLGLEIHEFPTISSKQKNVRLERGEVITIEPGVYLPGEFGMRYEDTIIVS